MAIPSLKERALDAIRRQPAQPRPGRISQALSAAGMIALTAGFMACALLLAGGTAHAAERPAPAAACIVGGTLLLAAAATWFALPPPRSMLPRPAGQRLAVMIGIPILVGACIAFGHPSYVEPFLRTGLRCFALTALTAPAPFVALFALTRRLDPVQPALSGGALGAAAGAWSAAMVELWCPLANASHVVLGHVAPLAVLTLAGAAAGAHLFKR